MILSVKEENSAGGFHSHVSLVNPHKEVKIKRVCQSEPFLKPKLSLKKALLRLFMGKSPVTAEVRIKQTSDKSDWENLTSPTAVNINPGHEGVLAKVNPTLKLSENEYSCSKTHKDRENNKNTRDRFNSWMCLQAEEGYRTEKCNLQDYYSQDNLLNQWKQKDTRKVQSIELHRPQLPLKKRRNETQETDYSLEECKRFLKQMATDLNKVYQEPVRLREEKTPVVQNLYSAVQNSITDKNIKTQNHSKSQNNKDEQVGTEQTYENAGGLQVPRKDWGVITRPSAKVILDPNTANPSLKLSQDGRSVRTKTFEEYESSQSYYELHRKQKHKYNGWMCVQAKEGYSTGRHYWEVDVKGKCDWRVGVVKESAERSGYVKLNTETGYWTLRLQLGTLIALTEPATKLNQAPPSKIGVQLDLEEGRVSFYDAEKRKHIYTFITDFSNSEKIYPVFGTVETHKPLKILEQNTYKSVMNNNNNNILHHIFK